MNFSPVDEDRERNTLFALLGDATLEWFGFVAGHQHLCLTATMSVNRVVYVHFAFTRYVDCPLTMHHVHLRNASQSEIAQLKTMLSPEEAEIVEPSAVLVIECEEGIYYVWAEQFGYSGPICQDTERLFFKLDSSPSLGLI